MENTEQNRSQQERAATGDPYCCYIDGVHGPCGATAEFEIRATRGNAIAGPDIYSDDTHACISHVGQLLGHQADAINPNEIYWEVRPIEPHPISQAIEEAV